LISILQPDGGQAELTLNVPTAHHQGIARLGDGLVPVAWAQDGLIEAGVLPPRAGHPPLLAAGATRLPAGAAPGAGGPARWAGARGPGRVGGRPGCGSPLIAAAEHLHSRT